MNNPRNSGDKPKLTQVRVTVKAALPDLVQAGSQIIAVHLLVNRDSVPNDFNYNNKTLVLKSGSHTFNLQLPTELTTSGVYHPSNGAFSPSMTYDYNLGDNGPLLPGAPFNQTIEQLEVSVDDESSYQLGGFEQSPSAFERLRGYVVIQEEI